jgi:hypothetical protein
MVPPPQAYFEPINWHRTALHELGHASGHPSRLGRDLGGVFGSKKYAFEEPDRPTNSLVRAMGAQWDCESRCRFEPNSTDPRCLRELADAMFGRPLFRSNASIVQPGKRN